MKTHKTTFINPREGEIKDIVDPSPNPLPAKYSAENIRNELWGDFEFVAVDLLRPYLGETLTLIESIGLPEKQEKAIKDIIRKDFYARSRQICDRFDSMYSDLKDFLRVQEVLPKSEDESFQCFGQSRSLFDNATRD